MSLDIYLKEEYSKNITHNLAQMASKAGIYTYLWRPDENGVKCAKELIEPIAKAIADMKERVEYYDQFNASNGWGTREQFIPWLEDLLIACKEHPEAEISVSR